jgi:hypothetical protein
MVAPPRAALLATEMERPRPVALDAVRVAAHAALSQAPATEPGAVEAAKQRLPA